VSAYCKEYIDRLTFYVNEHAKTTESRATQLLNDMLPKQVHPKNVHLFLVSSFLEAC
ncbi:guanylyl cyclase, partial [Toxoplasma gondii p89]